MPALPSFHIDASRVLPDGGREPLGRLDMTTPLIRAVLAGRGRGVPSREPSLYQMSDHLGRDALDAARSGTLALDGFAERAAAFVEGIGGVERVPDLKRAIDERAMARGRAEEAARLRDDVRAARAVPHAEGMLYDPYGDGFVSVPDEAYAGWPVPDFLAANPRPMALSGPAHEAWEAAREAHRRASAPPFLFATLPRRWAGISAADLREEAENAAAGEPGSEADAIDLDSMIENGLEEHFDDARDHVRGERALRELVRAWQPHAGSGDAVDLAFDGAIAEWNARQSLVSYHVDRSRIVLLRGDAAGAAAWCEEWLVRTIASLRAAEAGWPEAPACTAQ